jgi:hypothetical protein
MEDDKKSLLHYWQLIPNIFIAHLPILIRRSQSGVCALAIRCLIATVRGAVTVKGSHRMGDGQIFSKTFAPLFLMTTYWMSLISARIQKRRGVPLNRMKSSRYTNKWRHFLTFLLVIYVMGCKEDIPYLPYHSLALSSLCVAGTCFPIIADRGKGIWCHIR